jgi:predicted nuclease with TOPRIM domain
VAKPGLTWWEKERKLIRNKLDELLKDLNLLKKATKRVKTEPSQAHEQVKKLRKKLKL